MSKVEVISGKGKIEFSKEKDKETMAKKYPDVQFEKMNPLTFTTTYKGNEMFDLKIKVGATEIPCSFKKWAEPWKYGSKLALTPYFKDLGKKAIFSVSGGIQGKLFQFFRYDYEKMQKDNPQRQESIQLSSNDLIRIGDWVTMKKFGADGDVIEINLNSVKIQNFDKTITTIPTYKLISDSFTNWRGMSDSDGRRIKRAILVKASSIKFINDAEIKSLKKIDLIADYIKRRNDEIKSHNDLIQTDKIELINGRNFTNIGLFRAYIKSYLDNHSKINNKMTVMCRQLSPTPTGIPLEVYAFITDKDWTAYEGIVSDIFDHLLSALPSFDLENFELYSKY